MTMSLVSDHKDKLLSPIFTRRSIREENKDKKNPLLDISSLLVTHSFSVIMETITETSTKTRRPPSSTTSNFLSIFSYLQERNTNRIRMNQKQNHLSET